VDALEEVSERSEADAVVPQSPNSRLHRQEGYGEEAQAGMNGGRGVDGRLEVPDTRGEDVAGDGHEEGDE